MSLRHDLHLFLSDIFRERSRRKELAALLGTRHFTLYPGWFLPQGRLVLTAKCRGRKVTRDYLVPATSTFCLIRFLRSKEGQTFLNKLKQDFEA